MKILLRILINALAVLAAAHLIPGIAVESFWTAVLVAIVLGALNVTLGVVLKIIMLPLNILTFGFFTLVINGFVFWSASFVKGFSVSGFWAAFFGALVVTLVSVIGKRLLEEPRYQ